MKLNSLTPLQTKDILPTTLGIYLGLIRILTLVLPLVVTLQCETLVQICV